MDEVAHTNLQVAISFGKMVAGFFSALILSGTADLVFWLPKAGDTEHFILHNRHFFPLSQKFQIRPFQFTQDIEGITGFFELMFYPSTKPIVS